MKLDFIVPYIAMIIGLYFFKNGWIAFILYHALILGVLQYRKELKSWKKMFKGFRSLFGVLSIFLGLSGGVLIYFLIPYINLDSNISNALLSLGLSGNIWLFFVVYLHLALLELYT